MLGIGISLCKVAAKNIAAVAAVVESLYRQPDTTSIYFQPDGECRYLPRPTYLILQPDGESLYKQADDSNYYAY